MSEPLFRFRVITFRSLDYHRTLTLRERVLRQPLGKVLSGDDLANEQAQWHFGLFDASGKAGACLVAAPAGENAVRLRQMAVAPEFHSRGLGGRLLRLTEDELQRRGVFRVTLNARSTATGFYHRHGYHIRGQPFIEVGIPHQAMTKQLDVLHSS
ncbi:MAG: GNAT family N-acetyltransferase [Pseudohongiellaceae bacterium]